MITFGDAEVKVLFSLGDLQNKKWDNAREDNVDNFNSTGIFKYRLDKLYFY